MENTVIGRATDENMKITTGLESTTTLLLKRHGKQWLEDIVIIASQIIRMTWESA